MRVGSRSQLVAATALAVGLSLSPEAVWAQLSSGPSTSKPGAIEYKPGSVDGAAAARGSALEIPTRGVAPRPGDKAPVAAQPLPPNLTTPLVGKDKATRK